MKKRGLTLIELMVAMTIFVTVMTLSIGGFVAISKSRALIGIMKETQQKVRVANEMIIRYSKQAEYVNIAADKKSIQLYFDITSATPSAKKFALSTDGQDDLLYFECVTPVASTCSNWGLSTSLLGGRSKGIFLSNTDVFTLSTVLPAVLEVKLNISNNAAGYGAVGSDMLVENAVILGNLK